MGRDGRYFAGLHFSTWESCTIAWIAAEIIYRLLIQLQFVRAFCRCSDFLDSSIGHCSWTRFVPHADFDMEQLVSYPPIHILFCGAWDLIDTHTIMLAVLVEG